MNQNERMFGALIAAMQAALSRQCSDNLLMVGEMDAMLVRPDGSRVFRHKKNLIVAAGFDFIADAIGKAARPAAMGYIAIGTGTPAVTSVQTSLASELSRTAAAYSHVVGATSFQFEATFAAGVGSGAITEAGVFNAAAAGTMLDRVVFAVINKGVDDTLTQRFTFTMS